MMNIMVCGYGGHGKDTFCELMGLKYESSSIIALDRVIWPVWGAFNYATKHSCFADRHNNRVVWHTLIAEYNEADPTRLARDIYSKNQVYCGIRSEKEFLAAKEEGLFDLSIWVDASERLPAEATDSCKINSSYCDVIVNNNHGIDELRKKAEFFSSTIVASGNMLGGIGPPLQPMIAAWADSIFPERTITNALSKLVMEEIPEYLTSQHDPMELADLGILLNDIAHLAGYDLDEVIRKKMEVNINRTWEIDKVTGLMNHIDESEKGKKQ